MAKEIITLKGTKDGVKIILDENTAFDELLENILEKFKKTKSFFSSGNCRMVFEGAHINESDRLTLENKVSELLTECDVVIEYNEDKKDNAQSAEKKIFTDINEGYTRFYEGTVRSGRLLQSEGNLVVLGDINPGSEVVAAGNIVVMGTVRGIVHAGCTGNRNTFIVALNLSPTQIRIADIITRPPDEDNRKKIVPEKAYIKEETIYIEEFFTK